MLRVEPGWRGRQLYFGENLYSYLLNIVVIAISVSVVFRRWLLATNGMQKARFGLFRDLELVLRLGRERRTALLDPPFYLIRYHPNQISTTVGLGTGS